VNTKETVCKNATLQKRSQLALDEPGHRALALSLPGQEGLEVLSYNTIKDAFLWITRTINGRGIADKDAGFGRNEIPALAVNVF
jgi:hypothetical protein